jgi:hypothetical protein
MDPLSLGVGLVSSLFSGFGAKKRARRARAERQKYEAKIRGLEESRQAIIDPYAGVQDLSSMITNPFANLQVATKAAEFAASEKDISLATTLDTLRATGAGAGGATALAQAALRSKQGIAATIEQQEAQNVRLKAQGEAQAQARRIAEAQRLQQADVSGQRFMFGVREQREMTQLDRASAQAAGAAQRAAAYSSQANRAFGSALGAFGGLAVGTKGFGLFGEKGVGAAISNTSPATPNQNYGYNYDGGFSNNQFNFYQDLMNSPASYKSPS